MIKKAVFENDLIFGMQRELQAYDKKQAMASLNQAGEYLHSALEILEEAGLTAQADQLLHILHKIADDNAAKTKPVESLPNLQVFFDSGKFTPEDMKAAMQGDTEAIAKINVGMHEHGMSDHKVAQFLGKYYMPYHMAKKLLEGGHSSGLKMYQNPSPNAGDEITISPVGTTAPAPEAGEMGEQEISMKSLLASAADELGVANNVDSQDARRKPKNPTKVSDPHTKGLTPDKMVENLKHHGIVFNLADDGKADTLLEVELSDDNNVEEVQHDPADKSFEDES